MWHNNYIHLSRYISYHNVIYGHINTQIWLSVQIYLVCASLGIRYFNTMTNESVSVLWCCPCTLLTPVLITHHWPPSSPCASSDPRALQPHTHTHVSTHIPESYLSCIRTNSPERYRPSFSHIHSPLPLAGERLLSLSNHLCLGRAIKGSLLLCCCISSLSASLHPSFLFSTSAGKMLFKITLFKSKRRAMAWHHMANDWTVASLLHIWIAWIL